MKRSLVLAACLLASLGACSTPTADATNAQATAQAATAQIDAAVPVAFKLGCAGVSYADGAFKAAAPGLLAAGKLNTEQMRQEAAIFATAQATCATPPADAATAATALLGQASAIYLLLSPAPAAAPAS